MPARTIKSRSVCDVVFADNAPAFASARKV
jgi:hypothetical protein